MHSHGTELTVCLSCTLLSRRTLKKYGYLFELPSHIPQHQKHVGAYWSRRQELSALNSKNEKSMIAKEAESHCQQYIMQFWVASGLGKNDPKKVPFTSMLSIWPFGTSMGVQNTALPDVQPPTVVFTVPAQQCGPKGREVGTGATLLMI